MRKRGHGFRARMATKGGHRYALSETEWKTIQPILPNNSRGIPRSSVGVATIAYSDRGVRMRVPFDAHAGG